MLFEEDLTVHRGNIVTLNLEETGSKLQTFKFQNLKSVFNTW